VSTTYNPTATDTASYTLPSDGDAANAETVNSVFRGLANKALWLDQEKLQDIVQADANTPLIGSNSSPDSHPLSGIA
jgi:hypothetical protein